MTDWDRLFDELYLKTYAAIQRDEDAEPLALGAMRLAGCEPPADVLDAACGYGRHARVLAGAGYCVVGLDRSPVLLAEARRRSEGAEWPNWVQGDYRELPFAAASFDVVVNLFTSFGFFLEPADDARVIAEFARVLAPGGMLVWHGGSRDGVMARFLARDWWKADDGTMIAHERSFDPLSGVLTIRSSFEGPGASGEREHRIRLFTATRIAELCAAAGLIVTEAYDAFRDRPLGRRSTEMLLVARKD